MPRGRRLAAADEVTATPDARDAARRIAALEGTLVAVDAAGDRVDLPEGLSRLLRRASEEIAAGHNLTMLRSDEVLTPNEAAQVLGVSRQNLSRLLHDGVIPSETLPSSAHRRVLLADVLLFRPSATAGGPASKRSDVPSRMPAWLTPEQTRSGASLPGHQRPVPDHARDLLLAMAEDFPP